MKKKIFSCNLLNRNLIVQFSESMNTIAEIPISECIDVV